MQTSSKKLARQTKTEISSQLISLISDLQHPAEIEQFIQDFFTETEIIVFAKRLSIAYLLSQGKSYQEIKDELKVSSATISAVAEIKDKKGIKLAMKKIKADQKYQQQAEKIWRVVKKFRN
ncbi:MAG: YerC/YecD family TrpR-related protein [Candidatus Woesebacteria bacterium]|jgi:TrpR-related protein YerC/YecD